MIPQLQVLEGEGANDATFQISLRRRLREWTPRLSTLDRFLKVVEQGFEKLASSVQQLSSEIRGLRSSDKPGRPVPLRELLWGHTGNSIVESLRERIEAAELSELTTIESALKAALELDESTVRSLHARYPQHDLSNWSYQFDYYQRQLKELQATITATRLMRLAFKEK